MLELNRIHNLDNIVGMGKFPDKYFDLAIPDPPYGIGVAKTGVIGFGEKGKNKMADCKQYTPKEWDKKPPSKEYFQELFRVSRFQIIWGGNYFIDHLKPTPCMIVWDKDNSGNFADCELAWTNFDSAVRKFRWRWNGMLQQDMKHKETRIHPTQKPVALYRWILKNYAQAGWKILDTHVGSGSSIIACEKMGFDYCGFEIDSEYWEGANIRLQQEREKMKQTSLFGEKVL